MRQFDTWQDFKNHFIVDAMADGHAFLVVNWKDCYGVVAQMQQSTIRGNSIVMRSEELEPMYEDINEVKETDGDMLITVFGNGELIAEKVVDRPEAFVEGVYYVEESAKRHLIPTEYKVISFTVKTNVFDGVI